MYFLTFIINHEQYIIHIIQCEDQGPAFCDKDVNVMHFLPALMDEYIIGYRILSTVLAGIFTTRGPSLLERVTNQSIGSSSK